ncbi:MAG: elongation factor P hydroxylase [Alphaproteobacteria bacterium]|nr:elongation factor P hydroxylase [Alphaproteobacteria bacterium]
MTAIPREQLSKVLDRFMAKLEDPFSRAVFRRIRVTSADRAVGAAAERHRRAALSLARSLGMAVHAEGVECAFNWDGTALNSATEAYVILHEAAHFALAPSQRRRLVDFGLGPGPDTRDRDTAARAAVVSPLAREEDEAAASLLGIIWEAKLGQPALASFLDQNWLEGLERSAHSHFAAVVDKLQRRGLLDSTWPAVFGRPRTDRSGRAAAARTAEPGCTPDWFAETPGRCAKSPRPATPASIRRSFEPPDTRSLRGGSPDLPSEPPSRPPVKHGIGTRVPRG